MITKAARRASKKASWPVLEMWQTAIQAGLEIQEQTIHRSADLLAKFTPFPLWQGWASVAFSEACHLAQQNLEATIRWMNQSANRNLDVLQRAMEAGRKAVATGQGHVETGPTATEPGPSDEESAEAEGAEESLSHSL